MERHTGDMIETTIEGQDFTRVDLMLYPTGDFLGLDAVDRRSGGEPGIANLPYDAAHALADWIIANVPKPEPTPLPTKFGAVVKSNGFRFMRAAEDAWYRQGGGMCHDEDIRSHGFEIVSEGVDD